MKDTRTDSSDDEPSRFIESTAGEVADELTRRGVAPDQPVTIVIEPDDWLADARRFSGRLTASAISSW
jgi:hypothetical protein